MIFCALLHQNLGYSLLAFFCLRCVVATSSKAVALQRENSLALCCRGNRLSRVCVWCGPGCGVRLCVKKQVNTCARRMAYNQQQEARGGASPFPRGSEGQKEALTFTTNNFRFFLTPAQTPSHFYIFHLRRTTGNALFLSFPIFPSRSCSKPCMISIDQAR